MIKILTITMPIFVCFFWSLLIGADIIKKKPSLHRLYLLAFFITATLLYVGHGVFFTHSTEWMPGSDWMYATCNLAVYPLWFLYISALTQRQLSISEQFIILLPTLLGSVAIGVLYIIMPKEATDMFIGQYLYNNEMHMASTAATLQAQLHNACKVTFALQLIPVLYFGYRRIKKFNSLINSIYSDTENKVLPTSVNHIQLIFVLISIASFAVNAIGRHRFDDRLWLLAIPSVIFSLLLFAIGYVCYFYSFSMDDIKNDEEQADDFIRTKANPSDLRQRIEQVMEEKKLYLEPNLKLHDLVRYVQSNRNYVYNAINREMGVSFNEYVNRLRIDHSIQLIQQHPDMQLAEVAEKSGFTSIASFYRNFKLFTGKSPKEYSSGGKVRKPTDSDN